MGRFFLSKRGNPLIGYTCRYPLVGRHLGGCCATYPMHLYKMADDWARLLSKYTRDNVVGKDHLVIILTCITIYKPIDDTLLCANTPYSHRSTTQAIIKWQSSEQSWG